MRRFFTALVLLALPALVRMAGGALGSLRGRGVEGRDAWVYMASRCFDLHQVLGSARTLRSVGTRADIVVLAFGSLADTVMVEKGFGSVLGNLSVRVLPTSAPIFREQVSNASTQLAIDKAMKWWDFTKLRAWELTPYRRVIFLDADVFFTANMDDSFDLPECSRVAGASSPFNAGWFRVNPAVATFDDLVRIVASAGFDQRNGWNDQCSAYHPDVTRGRLCTAHEDGTKTLRVAGGESTQGLLAYYCDVVRDMRDNTMFNSTEFRDAPYGCRREPPSAVGRCRTVAEGVRAVHATAGCGKHPFACACPELYEAWWRAHSVNLAMLPPFGESLSAEYGAALDCLNPQGTHRSIRWRDKQYWTKNCQVDASSAIVDATRSTLDSAKAASIELSRASRRKMNGTESRLSFLVEWYGHLASRGTVTPQDAEYASKALQELVSTVAVLREKQVVAPDEFGSHKRESLEDRMSRLTALGRFLGRVMAGQGAPLGGDDGEYATAQLRDHRKHLAVVRAAHRESSASSAGG